MEVTPDCVHCLMKRVLFQSRLVDNGTEFESVAAGIEAFNKGFRKGRVSAHVATEVHRASYDAIGVADPYRELKLRSDKVAMEFLPEAERAVEESEDPLAEAVLMAVIGNIMDFGSGIAIDRPEEFRAQFQSLREQGIGFDDTECLREALEGGARNVLYLFDNCGEALFDTILIGQLRKLGARVVGVARGEPILNDVTLEDAERVGLDEKLDRLISTGQFAVGVDLDTAGDDLKEELAKADLIVSKGMANYEALSDADLNVPVVYILRSKCKPVADSLGVPLGINVVKYSGRR